MLILSLDMKTVLFMEVFIKIALDKNSRISFLEESSMQGFFTFFDVFSQSLERWKGCVFMKKIYLNVPYSDKEDAKELGARWDPSEKKWYTFENNDHLYDLLEWFPTKSEFLLFSPVYVVTSIRDCWKCKKISRVYSLGSHEVQVKHPLNVDHWEEALDCVVNAKNYVPDGLFLTSGIDSIDAQTTEYLKTHTPKYYPDFSKTANARYWMNHCEHCEAKLGDFDTHDEFGAAFAPLNLEQYQHISIQSTPISKVVISDCAIKDFWQIQKELLY
jgi:hypothetical protein